MSSEILLEHNQNGYNVIAMDCWDLQSVIDLIIDDSDNSGILIRLSQSPDSKTTNWYHKNDHYDFCKVIKVLEMNHCIWNDIKWY